MFNMMGRSFLNLYLPSPCYFKPFLRYFLNQSQIEKIQRISTSIFVNIKRWDHLLETRNDSLDIKTIAMVSCVSLTGIALLIISLLYKDKKGSSSDASLGKD
jgi:hypothetical protein